MASPPQEPSALERLRRLEAGLPPDKPTSAPPPPPTAEAAPAGATRKRGVIVSALIAIGLLLSKLKFLLVGLKLGKFVTTSWTMLLMAWTYSLYYGWSFAAMIVLLILLHELGHGLAARLVGIEVGAPIFIPFFGAFIALKERPRSTYEDFFIGAGGPLAGGLAALSCVALSFALSGAAAGLFLVVGYFALIMNLFNLMPLWQLDGRRMLSAARWRDGAMGLVLAVVVLALTASRAQHLNPIALFVILACTFRLGADWHQARSAGDGTLLGRLQALERAEATAGDAVSPAQRTTAALVYFATLTLLITAVHGVQTLIPAAP